MSTRTLWLAGIVSVTLTLLALIAGITVATVDARQSDERERVTCMNAGGTYVGDEELCILGDDE